jgi:hypothetical protein
VLRKNRWQPIGGVRLTNRDGVFVRTVRLRRGALLRVRVPPGLRFSVQLRVR